MRILSCSSLVCTVAVWAGFCGVARAEFVVHTNMAGSASCALYLKARSRHQTLPFELWLSGYLTGLATYDKKINKVAGLDAANGERGASLLENYCKMHPLDNYQSAAREMARSIFYSSAQ